MDSDLGQHAVVLQLTLSERGSVSGNENQLGLAGTESLEGRLVSQANCENMHQNLFSLLTMATWQERNSPFPDFITSARRELRLSEVFFFLGAIVNVVQAVLDPSV